MIQILICEKCSCFKKKWHGWNKRVENDWSRIVAGKKLLQIKIIFASWYVQIVGHKI